MRPSSRPRGVEQHAARKRPQARGEERHQQRGGRADRGTHPRRRHEPDEDARAAGEQRELEPERPVGPHQVRAVEDLLDQLRVQLHARNLLAERRRLVVEEADARDAEEHELRAQELRVGLAGEELEADTKRVGSCRL